MERDQEQLLEQEDTTPQQEDTTLLLPKLLNMVVKNKLKARKHRHINRERHIHHSTWWCTMSREDIHQRLKLPHVV